jgi:hypothetical protein
MFSSDKIGDSIRPLLKLCREHIDRSIRLDMALLRSLERDPPLAGEFLNFARVTLSQRALGRAGS